MANTAQTSQQIAGAVSEVMPLAADLFADLAANTRAEDGVSFARISYGEGEQYASDLVARTAAGLGLETTVDYVGNLYVSLPGKDPSLPVVMTGSHLDSAIRGGNYDGGAGVVAGLAALAALKRMGVSYARTVTLLCTRSEESGSWFGGKHGGHLGGRAALGLLKAEELEEAVRLDSGKTLAWHMEALGFSPKDYLANPPWIDPKKVACWIETHIEQGPVLAEEKFPLGIVTGIRGFISARTAVCRGVWTHAGGTPEAYRHDAVKATAEFIYRLNEKARTLREQDHKDITLTVGRLFTDPEKHSITKVPGEVSFSMDMRSQSRELVEAFAAFARTLAVEVGERHRVQFDLGPFSPTPAATMDPALRDRLHRGADELGLKVRDIACGASHDTVDFVDVGIPSAMIFIRNYNGSHNPDERIDPDDFRQAVMLLTWFIDRSAAA